MFVGIDLKRVFASHVSTIDISSTISKPPSNSFGLIDGAFSRPFKPNKRWIVPLGKPVVSFIRLAARPVGAAKRIGKGVAAPVEACAEGMKALAKGDFTVKSQFRENYVGDFSDLIVVIDGLEKIRQGAIASAQAIGLNDLVEGFTIE